MDRNKIIKLQGREFVTYEGLLDEAHRQGLTQIETQLVQVPGPTTDHTAIVHAIVTLIDPDTGLTKTFSGLGDASPKNVSRQVALHLIRMAETRAKARALRDAINVGYCALEETEHGELPDEERARRPDAEPTERLASKAQIDRVGAEITRVGMTPEDGVAWLTKNFNKKRRQDLTEREIETFEKHLKSLPTATPELEDTPV